MLKKSALLKGTASAVQQMLCRKAVLGAEVRFLFSIVPIQQHL
jgi:hypothetical protein